jgi:hypothetical protein
METQKLIIQEFRDEIQELDLVLNSKSSTAIVDLLSGNSRPLQECLWLDSPVPCVRQREPCDATRCSRKSADSCDIGSIHVFTLC